jgi:hypothetical protein
MKLNGTPVLLRTIIGEVEHKGKIYSITIKEDETENDFEIYLLDGMFAPESEIDPDSDLGKKLVEFFSIETEDIEQFL